MIKPTFVTELGKGFLIYGLITFSDKSKKDNKQDLIRPSDNLKFELQKDLNKSSLSFELGKVHEKKSFSVVSDRVFNFGILQRKKNKTIGEKRPMTLDIIDMIQILGIQDKNYNFINLVNVSISSDNVIQELTKYRKSI